MDFQWTKKDLLDLYDLSRDEILHILNTAERSYRSSRSFFVHWKSITGGILIVF